MTVSADQRPDRLGCYRLGEQLGAGGMGVVYLATAPDERLVAVKVLRQSVMTDETAKRRLAREVETMRRVQSPYVAEVVDADVQGDPPYIVTRYVPGRTLEDIVDETGPLSGDELVSLASGLAAALSAVHAAGVVHRDLKPANVMMVDGQPVVIDFGIAQAPDSTRLTMTGMFMGTPGYLAPEVIEGTPSGPAADVHSWGATLAFAATGRPPFGTGAFEVIFYRIVHGQPDLDRLPNPLLPLVLAALARDPARRPAAADLCVRAASLRPAEMVPGLASAAVPVTDDGPATRTAFDLPPAGLPGAGLPGPGLRALDQQDGQAARANGTRPMPARPRDEYADLLPPVSYQAGAGQPVRPARPVRPLPEPVAGRVASVRGQPAAIPASGAPTLPLVIAAVAVAAAVGAMLPVAGSAAALLVLMLLRAGDLTSRLLDRRRARSGPRGSDPVAATAYLPWAVCRSALLMVALAPLALLAAAGVAAAVIVAAPDQPLYRAVAWAAAAAVACYGLGPGSAGARRPLTRLFGSLTRTSAQATVVYIGMLALAAGVLVAAATQPPSFWPAHQLSMHLQQPHQLSYVVTQFWSRITSLVHHLGW
jgi:Protein kinase domain